jgi:hypothetical protein
MTKSTVGLTDEELLGVIEKNLRKRRLSARQAASLMRQHDRLRKKIAGEGPRRGRPPGETSRPTDEQVLAEVLGGRSARELTFEDEKILIERLGQERAVWALVYKIEDEQLAKVKAQPQPEQKTVVPALPEGVALYGPAGRPPVAVKAAPAKPTVTIKADID